MFILILLFTFVNCEINCDINFTDCTYCSKQICIFSYNSSYGSGDPIEFMKDHLQCICDNTTCGKFCEKRWYTRDEIVSCVRKNPLFCSLNKFVDEPKAVAALILFCIIMTFSGFGVVFIFANIFAWLNNDAILFDPVVKIIVKLMIGLSILVLIPFLPLVITIAVKASDVKNYQNDNFLVASQLKEGQYCY